MKIGRKKTWSVDYSAAVESKSSLLNFSKKRLSEKDFETRVRGRIDFACETMRPWLLNARYNMAFFQGVQDLVLSDVAITYRGLGASYESRLQENHYATLVSALAQRILSDDPRAMVVAVGGDSKSQLSARISNNVLRANEDRMKYEMLLDSQSLMLILTGACYWWTLWDPDVGIQTADGKWKRLGDALTVGLTPMEVAMDPMTEDPNLSSWYAIRGLRPYGWIRETFENGKYVEPSQKSKASKWIENLRTLPDMVRNVFAGPFSGLAKPKSSDDEKMVVFEQYVERYVDQETGRPALVLLKLCNDVILEEPVLLDYDPLSVSYNKKLPGTLFPATVATDLTKMQDEYNRSVRAIQDHLRILTHPIPMVDVNSNVDPELLTLDPNLVVPYDSTNGGQPISYLQAPSLNAEAYSWPDRIYSKMLDLAGIHDASLGKQPYANMPYKSLKHLTVQDTTNLAMAARGFFRGIMDESMKRLHLYRNYASEKRMARIEGRNGQAALSFEFRKNDLMDSEFVRMNVVGAPGIDPVQRQDINDNLMMNGLFDPRRKSELREYEKRLGIPITQDMELDEMLQGYQQAELENEAWRRGENGDVDAARNEAHDIHIQSHRLLRNSQEVLSWSDDVIASLENHLAYHEMWGLSLAQEAAAPMAGMAAAGAGA